MELLTGALFAASLLAALCVQHNLSVMAGAWLFPLLILVAVQVRSRPFNPPADSSVAKASALWLFAIGASVFILQPVSGAASVGWVLAACPLLAISLRPSGVVAAGKAAVLVTLLYALVLIGQVVMHVYYTAPFNYASHFGWRLPAWPLIDPNNAACIMVVGFIYAFEAFLNRRSLLAGPAAIIYLAALLLTESKAGMLAAGLASAVLFLHRPNPKHTLLIAAIVLSAAAAGLWLGWEEVAGDMRSAIHSRMALWRGAAPLVDLSPWGIGLGRFNIFYAAVRQETITSGYYLHNDIYQMVIEMGWYCVLPLLALICCVADSTSRTNVVPACILGAILLMSCLEFQLYLPAVSLLAGLALAAHLHLAEPESRRR